MLIRKVIGTLLLVGLILAPAALADEKLDQLEKEIAAKWKDIKSMTAKMEMSMDMDQSGMKMKQTMKAAVEYLRKAEKMMSRLEGESNVAMDMGGQTQNMKSTMLAVSDGEFTHTLVEQMGQKMCMKSKADASATTGEEMIKLLKEQSDLSVGADEEVNGDKCWVLVAKSKQMQPGAAAKTCYYFRQKDGVIVQWIGYDASDKQNMTVKFTDVKLNETIDPACFEFKVPEGVQVMDNTGQQP